MDLETIAVESWTPWSAADLRNNLRRTATSEDSLLAQFLAAATRHVERRTKTSILGRTLALYLPAWPTEYVELPAPPLRYAAEAQPETAVTVRYRNDLGTWTTAAADTLRIERRAQVWVMTPGATAAPTLNATSSRMVQVAFTVGYRDAAHLRTEAPDLADAIMLLASHRDQNREATTVEPRVMNVSRKVELAFDDLVRQHIVVTRYKPLWV